MRRAPAVRRLIPGILVLILAWPLAAVSVTKSQVEAACEDSEAAYAAFQDAEERFVEASLSYEEAANDVARVERQQVNISGAIDSRQASTDDLAVAAEEKAVEMYMRGTTAAPGLLLSVTNVGEAMSSAEMLAAAAEDDQASLSALAALEADLARFQEELTVVEAELREVEGERLDALDRQDQARLDAQAAYADLSDKCKELNRKYKQEQAAAAARAAARAQGKSGAAAGASPQATSGFICPMTPGRTSFIDSWGFARSGGRAHKGTDMMAAWNEPVFAVADGSVSIRSGGLGGKIVWLIADNGTGYYYAHLNDWAVGNGARVSRGQTIGYNGDSGNARGGSPHVHFEIHPGGRGAPAVNPYPTLAAACF
ncbi:MAG TPA: M23 family metallopeptidase [Acidimicrobiia bacterium]|nr:M23 family metallopeptidase [Acidimicrobiia bacterium]